jgi:hypothetical protein
MIKAAVKKGVDLRLEEIDRARKTKHHDKGQTKESSVKMPTPDQTVSGAHVGRRRKPRDWTGYNAHFVSFRSKRRGPDMSTRARRGDALMKDK